MTEAYKKRLESIPKHIQKQVKADLNFLDWLDEQKKAYHLHCLESVTDEEMVEMFTKTQRGADAFSGAWYLRDHLIQQSNTNQP